MRFLFFLIIFLCAGTTTAQANALLEEALWQQYVVKSDEWIYKIVRESPLVQSGTLDLEQVVTAILSKNPQIKDPNKIMPGLKVLLPIYVIPKPQFPLAAGATINYNFYINSTVYNGSTHPSALNRGRVTKNSYDSLALEKPKLTGNSHRAPALQPEIKQPLNKINTFSQKLKFNLNVGADFSYYHIESIQTSNQSKATQASDLSYGLRANLNHNIFKSFQLNYLARINAEKYKAGDANIFNFGVGLSKELTSRFKVLLAGYYGQAPVLTTKSGDLFIESVTLPKLGLQIDYRLFTILNTQVIAELNYKSFLSGSGSNIEIESGNSYQVSIGLKRNFKNQALMLRLWLESSSLSTNSTEQSHSQLGSGLQWAF